MFVHQHLFHPAVLFFFLLLHNMVLVYVCMYCTHCEILKSCCLYTDYLLQVLQFKAKPKCGVSSAAVPETATITCLQKKKVLFRATCSPNQALVIDGCVQAHLHCGYPQNKLLSPVPVRRTSAPEWSLSTKQAPPLYGGYRRQVPLRGGCRKIKSCWMYLFIKGQSDALLLGNK